MNENKILLKNSIHPLLKISMNFQPVQKFPNHLDTLEANC